MKILVTGSAIRIGRALVLGLAQKGHHLVIHYNSSKNDAEELLKLIGGKKKGHAIIQANLLNSQERMNIIPLLLKKNIKIDCLINNASTFIKRDLKSLTIEELKEDFEINFFAPFNLMQSFAREIKRGLIINFLDQRINTIHPDAGTYAFAKKSLRDASQAAALDWAPEIRVNSIAPGAILAPPNMNQDFLNSQISSIPMKAISGLNEIINSCLYLINNPTINGQILYIDGGLHLASPLCPEKL